MDAEFFDQGHTAVAARTIGKHSTTDYARTTLYPHQGAVPIKPDGKKGHKKEKKTKRRDNWTKELF